MRDPKSRARPFLFDARAFEVRTSIADTAKAAEAARFQMELNASIKRHKKRNKIWVTLVYVTCIVVGGFFFLCWEFSWRDNISRPNQRQR